jgi:hypothetical protein
MKKTVSLSWIFVFIAGILLAEYVLLPWAIGMPRDAFLMGFCINSKKIPQVDDTPINKMGFTGDVLKRKKAPGTIRILTLGGSPMFNRRMTERLKEKLQAASSKPVEVLGAALRTHTIRSSLYKYEFLAKYDFDYVLICHGINSLWANHVSKNDYREDYFQLGEWYSRGWLLQNSVIARLLYNNFFYHRPPRIFYGAKFASLKTFKHNLDALIRRIKKNGSQPILITFAWHIPDNYTYEGFQRNSLGYDNPAQYDKCPVELWGSVAYVSEGLKRTNEIVRNAAVEENLYLIDQDKLMSGDITLFGDACHFNEKGVDVFIDNTMKFLKEKNLL